MFPLVVQEHAVVQELVVVVVVVRDVILRVLGAEEAMHRVDDLFFQGYNWYSSIPLFPYLTSKGTVATGTAKVCRIKSRLPESFTKAKLKKGDYLYRRDENLLAVRYHDKKGIYLLSTQHDMSVVSVPKKYGEGDVERLRVVNDYNKNMGGVDKNDMMINNYSCVRKT